MKELKSWTMTDYMKFIPPTIGTIFLIVVAIIFKDIGVIGTACLFAIIIGSIPYFLFSYIRYREVSAMESQLPNFLRDLVEEVRSGMTLPKAIQLVSNVDYGKLSKEVKKMYHQLSWGIPIQDVLKMFAERVKESNLIRRSVHILIEAYKSGGDIVSAMENVATDVAQIKALEDERKSQMSYHTATLYIVYFIFIVIVIVLTNFISSMTIIPEELKGGGEAFGTQLLEIKGPCESPGSPMTRNICGFMSGPCKIFDFGTGSECYYKSVFLFMILIQGMCSGLVAGQAGSDSIVVGFKHGLIMMGIGFPIYILAIKIGIGVI